MSKDGKSPEQPPSGDGHGATNGKTPEKPSIESASAAVAAEYDADVYFYSGEIGSDGYGRLVQELAQDGARENALLILVTNGGSGNAAYQIARLLQKTYNRFLLYCPSYCKSAGTVVALGAHMIIMDSFSELGPLDVQLPSRDELWGQRSGLVTKSAFKSLTEASFDMYQQMMMSIKVQSRNAISFKLASDISVRMTSQLMAPIYAQINPETIGSDFRDLDVAREYGKRLAEYSGNARRGAVDKLVTNYPSHDFIIDDDEAKKLFVNVKPPKQSLHTLLGLIGDDAYGEARVPVVQLLGVENEPDNQEGSQYGVAPPPGLVARGKVDRKGNPEPRSNGRAKLRSRSTRAAKNRRIETD